MGNPENYVENNKQLFAQTKNKYKVKKVNIMLPMLKVAHLLFGHIINIISNKRIIIKNSSLQIFKNPL